MRTFTFKHAGGDSAGHPNYGWTGVPIVAANMDTTGTFETAKVLAQYHMLTCISKHNDINKWVHKLDGYGVCQELRKESDVPIVMLTALGDVADRITGLELGADDYVVKPFSPKELEARIRCVLRRVEKEQVAGIPNSGVIQVSDLRIDTNKRQVFRGDERIRLTGMEFSLLELLVSRSGEPFNRGEILKEVWGYTPERHERIVDSVASEGP